jgi:hypothetical protein
MARLVADDVLQGADALALDLYGLSSSQAAIELWRAERMPLPLRLLTDAERLDVLRQSLQAAETVFSALRGSVWVLASTALASGERSPDKKDVGALADRLAAGPRYWAALGAGFDALVRSLGSDEDTEAALSAWTKKACQAARRALDEAARQLGPNGRALQAHALASKKLAIELAKLAPTPSTPPTQEGAAA